MNVIVRWFLILFLQCQHQLNYVFVLNAQSRVNCADTRRGGQRNEADIRQIRGARRSRRIAGAVRRSFWRRNQNACKWIVQKKSYQLSSPVRVFSKLFDIEITFRDHSGMKASLKATRLAFISGTTCDIQRTAAAKLARLESLRSWLPVQTKNSTPKESCKVKKENSEAQQIGRAHV